MWAYGDSGNIENRRTFSYTTGAVDINAYTTYTNYHYTNSNWGDLLTQYGDTVFSYDAIGNLLSDGSRTFTWRHGRQLATLSDGTATWTYTYDSDGLRTKRTDGTNTYRYTYADGKLSHMIAKDKEIFIAYDGLGQPLSISHNKTAYFYVTNLQGDVVALLDSSGTAVVQYTYDAWGNVLSVSGSMADTLGTYNPLRYRGYVYDQETGLYYLQSRYYDPEVGRFINADGLISTGQGFTGNNMFAYCGNNPVNNIDPWGLCYYDAQGNWRHDNWEYIGGYKRKPDPKNFEEMTALNGGTVTSYKNVPVIRNNVMKDAAFSFGGILLGSEIQATSSGVRTLRHEYGHTRQLRDMGPISYTCFVVVPSVTCFCLNSQGKLNTHYYSLPWEYEADVYGNVQGRTYNSHTQQAYYLYKFFVSLFSGKGLNSDYACRINS